MASLPGSVRTDRPWVYKYCTHRTRIPAPVGVPPSLSLSLALPLALRLLPSGSLLGVSLARFRRVSPRRHALCALATRHSPTLHPAHTCPLSSSCFMHSYYPAGSCACITPVFRRAFDMLTLLLGSSLVRTSTHALISHSAKEVRDRSIISDYSGCILTATASMRTSGSAASARNSGHVSFGRPPRSSLAGFQ